MIEICSNYINTYVHKNRYTKYISNTTCTSGIELVLMDTYLQLSIQYTIQVTIVRQEWSSQYFGIRVQLSIHYIIQVLIVCQE